MVSAKGSCYLAVAAIGYEQQFLPYDLGNALDDRPGEHWLDVCSPAVRAVMKNRLDLAQQKGCDNVEPDNLDGALTD